jgi:hypothetical protein
MSLSVEVKRPDFRGKRSLSQGTGQWIKDRESSVGFKAMMTRFEAFICPFFTLCSHAHRFIREDVRETQEVTLPLEILTKRSFP